MRLFKKYHILIFFSILKKEKKLNQAFLQAIMLVYLLGNVLFKCSWQSKSELMHRHAKTIFVAFGPKEYDSKYYPLSSEESK